MKNLTWGEDWAIATEKLDRNPHIPKPIEEQVKIIVDDVVEKATEEKAEETTEEKKKKKKGEAAMFATEPPERKISDEKKATQKQVEEKIVKGLSADMKGYLK